MTEQSLQSLLSKPPQTEFAETIDALMSKDPASFTDADCDRVVKELRAQRGAFLITEKQPKGKNKIAAPSNMNLDDLGH